MPYSFLIGEDIVVTLSHYADGAVGDLEFRLVDLVTGDPVVDWAEAGIVQITASGDGPPWTYAATRSSVGLLAGTYQAQWRSTAPDSIVATLSHFADGDDLDFRLVDLASGDPAIDWASTGIVQTTVSGDGPPWVYAATRNVDDLPSGTYQAQWKTATAGPWIDDDEITLPASPAGPWVDEDEILVGTIWGWDPPPVDDLSALIFARVTGEYGPLEVWTATTRPTRVQAQTKINMAMGLIGAQLPTVLDTRYHAAARALVILTAAILTEPGYWPEDLKDYRDAVEEWRKERDAALKGLLARIKADDEDDAIGETRDAGVSAFNPPCTTDLCGDFVWCNLLPPVELV